LKLLFENWRKHLLNEVSFADAKEILNSKGTLKIIKNYEYEMKKLYGGRVKEPKEWLHKQFKDWLLEAVPDDLTDNQKGTAVLWLRKLAKEDFKVTKAFIDGDTSSRGSKYGRLWDDFEAFFHHQRFMPQQDLMSVKTIDDLQRMVDEAKDDIHAAQKEKQYLDAEEGTEVFRHDGELYIAALHNKGAACELGKGTDWCTAAPGLDYFSDYYSEDDPLIYIENKAGGADERWQFHYGSGQFMDINDHPINKDASASLFNYLHNAVMDTDIPQKYPIVQRYHYVMIASDPKTSPEVLADIVDIYDSGEPFPTTALIDVAKNPNTPSKSLKKLYRATHDIYIVRNIHANPAVDFDLAKEIFLSNPDDPIISYRGTQQMMKFAAKGEISQEEATKLIGVVGKKKDELAKGYHKASVMQENTGIKTKQLFKGWRKYLNHKEV